MPACAIVIFLAKQLVFIGAPAFDAPAKYGLTRAQIADIDREMTVAQQQRDAINDSASSLGIEPSPCFFLPERSRTNVDITGTVVSVVAGWDHVRRVVAQLACVKLDDGQTATVLLPSGELRLGRAAWCTGSRSSDVKEGQRVHLRARKDGDYFVATVTPP